MHRAGAGAAGALNQWYEADLDAKMKRTAKRPLPAGRMDRQSALHFGVGLSVFSVILMGLAANWLAAALLAVSILFYVLVYTVWLKRRTAQNIVIGGAAGAFPPLIGWVAATGDVARCRCCCSRSSSCGRRRISGRCRCSSAPIMPPPGADAAGGRGPRSDAPPDPPLQPADDRRGDRALAAGPGRPDLRRASPRS